MSVAWSFLTLHSTLLIVCAAAEPDYQVIRRFAQMAGDPTALVEASDGFLYGTMAGGRKAEGVVFKLSRDGKDYIVLHHFTGYLDREDGSYAQGVLEGSDGALYGATQSGGRPASVIHETGGGTVFKVNKDGTGYKILHWFPGRQNDGVCPWAGLAEGPDGALYGTTLEGGAAKAGCVFKLNKDGSGYAVLHSFGTAPNGADGARPMAGLLACADGWLYGTTDSGGGTGGNNGTVYRLKTNGSGFKVLHAFPEKPGDGRMPRTGLLEGRDGGLHGTTRNGGESDAGTVFRIAKDGNNYQVLHQFNGSFRTRADPNGRIEGVQNGVPTKFSSEGDGYDPVSLVQGADGSLYGVTETQGKNGSGTLFKLNPDGTGFAILHNFGANEEDGSTASRALACGSDGAIYGMTKYSAAGNFPSLYRVSPTRSKPAGPGAAK